MEFELNQIEKDKWHCLHLASFNKAAKPIWPFGPWLKQNKGENFPLAPTTRGRSMSCRGARPLEGEAIGTGWTEKGLTVAA
jgi:hypothetical protein